MGYAWMTAARSHRHPTMPLISLGQTSSAPALVNGGLTEAIFKDLEVMNNRLLYSKPGGPCRFRISGEGLARFQGVRMGIAQLESPSYNNLQQYVSGIGYMGRSWWGACRRQCGVVPASLKSLNLSETCRVIAAHPSSFY